MVTYTNWYFMSHLYGEKRLKSDFHVRHQTTETAPHSQMSPQLTKQENQLFPRAKLVKNSKIFCFGGAKPPKPPPPQKDPCLKTNQKKTPRREKHFIKKEKTPPNARPSPPA